MSTFRDDEAQTFLRFCQNYAVISTRRWTDQIGMILCEDKPGNMFRRKSTTRASKQAQASPRAPAPAPRERCSPTFEIDNLQVLHASSGALQEDALSAIKARLNGAGWSVWPSKYRPIDSHPTLRFESIYTSADPSDLRRLSTIKPSEAAAAIERRPRPSFNAVPRQTKSPVLLTSTVSNSPLPSKLYRSRTEGTVAVDEPIASNSTPSFRKQGARARRWRV
jgi:hypothetical protein